MAPPAIVKIVGRSIIDSRGNPTVEADVSEFWKEGKREAEAEKSVRSAAKRSASGAVLVLGGAGWA